MKWILPLIIVFSAQAKLITSRPALEQDLGVHGSIVMGSIWNTLGWPTQEAPDFRPVPDVEPDPQKKLAPTPKIKPEPTPEKLSRGQTAVQEMLKKNRERLKQMSKNNKAEPEKKNLSLKEQYLRNLNDLKKLNQDTLSSWQAQRDSTLKRWKQKQRDFLNQLDDFKKAQFNFESPSHPVGPSKLKKMVSKPIKGKFHVIPGAFAIEIKNQGKRPTCAAFAGVRAIETLMAGNGQIMDLSEHYLYWLAKPTCQHSPCDKRGSWVSRPFSNSASFPKVDIPFETDCPYSSFDKPSNQTHLPLPQGCKNGKVQVGDFETIETLDEVLKALDLNRPVVAGFKLSPNFYENNGLITYLNSKSSGVMDSHANGHALLLIGYIKLPPELTQRGEGKVCFVSANSWGEGWGQGGYSCLSESWVRHHRIKTAFLALNSAKIN